MIPDIVLELSVEQLISALNKKLSIECINIRPTTAPGMATFAAEIDALEKRANEILHGVTCLKNHLRPANRLPPEIVALCAAFVDPRTDPQSLVSLTHVCRYWRGTIISSPGNWTSIDSNWKELIPLFLERSGATPLTADISVSDIQEDKDFIRKTWVSMYANMGIYAHMRTEPN